MTIQPLIDSFLAWLKEAYTANTDFSKNRGWNMLGFDSDITYQDISDYFDRADLNKDYVGKYNNTDIPTKEAYAFIQAEINMIYGFHKSFVARHKTRLGYYRDDTAMKNFHTWNCINLAFGRFLGEKIIAERPDYFSATS